MSEKISRRLTEIKERMALAALRSGRDPSEVKLVAVSKTHPAGVLTDAIDSGIKIFGENKVQEAERKIIEIGRDAAEWHLIGHLQKNKTRKAVKLFDFIHSVDSVALAERLERNCFEEEQRSLNVLIQVDLAGEASKSGIAVEELPKLITFLGSCERLALKGFMLLPPFFDDAEKTRPFFKKLLAIRDEILPGSELSMGMTNDFEVAIEEGATMVRIGTALFGERDYGDPN